MHLLEIFTPNHSPWAQQHKRMKPLSGLEGKSGSSRKATSSELSPHTASLTPAGLESDVTAARGRTACTVSARNSSQDCATENILQQLGRVTGGPNTASLCAKESGPEQFAERDPGEPIHSLARHPTPAGSPALCQSLHDTQLNPSVLRLWKVP